MINLYAQYEQTIRTKIPKIRYAPRQVKLEIKKTAIGGIMTPEKERPMVAYPKAAPILSLNQFEINFDVLKLPKITIPNETKAP